jgi:hypothetical protein
MRYLINFLFSLSLLFTQLGLFSFEIKCPYDCGNPGNDPDVTKIGKEFKKCLKDLNLLRDQNVPWFNPDFIVDNSFLEKNHEKQYPNAGSIKWEAEKFEAETDEESDYYEFSRDIFFNEKENLDEKIEKNIKSSSYDFHSFNEYLQAFNNIREDLFFILNAERSYYEQRISDIKLEIDYLKKRKHIDYDDPYFGITNDKLKKDFQKDIQEVEKCYNDMLNLSYGYQGSIEKIFLHIFDWCIEHHNWAGAYYQRSLLNFNNGNVFEALLDIKGLIQNADNLETSIYFLKGQTESELGLFHDAIVSLSKVIEKDPKNQNAYLERALAYFETG